LERGAEPAPLVEARRESPAVASLSAEVRPDNRQPRGVAIRKRMQQHTVDQAEDCRGRSNAERKNQDAEQVECRTAAEQTQTLEEVAEKSNLDHGFTSAGMSQ